MNGINHASHWNVFGDDQDGLKRYQNWTGEIEKKTNEFRSSNIHKKEDINKKERKEKAKLI